jgi:hypothetical protein
LQPYAVTDMFYIGTCDDKYEDSCVETFSALVRLQYTNAACLVAVYKNKLTHPFFILLICGYLLG